MTPDRRAVLRAVLLGSGGMLAAAATAPFIEGVRLVLAAGDDAAVLTTLVELEDTAIQVLTAVGPGLVRAPLPGLAQSFLNHHRDHRQALVAAVRGLGAPAPATGQPHPDALPTGTGDTAALAALLEIEGRLLGAQYGALSALQRQRQRVQVASILGVDARHAAVWRSASGQTPVTGSFVTGP